MENDLVSICILNRDGIRLHNILKNTIESIKMYTPVNTYEIIVLDNCSTDNSVKYMESIGGITIVKNNKNSGFAEGNNLLVSKYANGKYILLLNNDVVITTTDWLSRMVDFMKKHPMIGLIGAGAGYTDPVTWRHAGLLPAEYIGEVEYVEGWCLLTYKEMYIKVDGLDERFFYYAEDHDFALKIKQAGYKVWKINKAGIYHLGNQSSKNFTDFKCDEISKQSTQKLIEKWNTNTKIDYTKYKSVLCLRTAAKGDILNTTPTIHQIKKINANIRITYWVHDRFSDILFNNKDIDRIVALLNQYAIEKESYDVVINFDDYNIGDPVCRDSQEIIRRILLSNRNIIYRFYHPLMNSKIETRKERGNQKKKYVNIFSEIAGVDLENTYPIFNGKEQPLSVNNYIAVSLDSGWESRSMPIEMANRLLDKLSDLFTVVLIGLNNGQPIIDKPGKLINMLGKTKNINDVWNIIKQSNGFIGIDSLPTHLANMLNIPNISIWSITEPEHCVAKYSDQYIRFVPDTKKVKCYPCYLEKCDLSDDKYLCWNNISVDNIVNEAEQLFIKQKQTLVTVILTSYNRDVLLRQAIDSVLNQTYLNIEFFIVDDGSKQETRKIIEHYVSNHKSIKYIQTNRSDSARYLKANYCENINTCLKQATGKYVCYLTCDDMYYPNHVELMAKALDEDPNKMIVFGDQNVMQYDDNTGESKWKYTFMWYQPTDTTIKNAFCRIDHNSVMHRMECVDKVGYWDDDIKVVREGDAYYWRKLNQHWVFHRVPVITTEHRLHEKSIHEQIKELK